MEGGIGGEEEELEGAAHRVVNESVQLCVEQQTLSVQSVSASMSCVSTKTLI